MTISPLIVTILSPIAGTLSDKIGSELLTLAGLLFMGAGFCPMSFLKESSPSTQRNMPTRFRIIHIDLCRNFCIGDGCRARIVSDCKQFLDYVICPQKQAWYSRKYQFSFTEFGADCRYCSIYNALIQLYERKIKVPRFRLCSWQR